MTKRLTFRILAVFFMILTLSNSWARDIYAQTPELDVLDQYAGNWDVEMTIDPLDENKDPKSFRGHVDAKWTVGNRFLEQTGRYLLNKEAEPLIIKTLMKYDSMEEKYRYWYFISSGDVRESEGRWDEQTKTMTSMMESENGDVTTITADFSEQGEENWLIETHRRKDDALVLRIRGKNRRRK